MGDTWLDACNCKEIGPPLYIISTHWVPTPNESSKVIQDMIGTFFYHDIDQIKKPILMLTLHPIVWKKFYFDPYYG